MKNYKLTIFPSLKDNDLTHAIFSRWVVKSASMGAIWGNSSAAYLKKKSFTHSRNQQWKTPNTIISESLTRTMLQLTKWKSSPKQLPFENNAYQVMHLHNRQDSCIMLNRNLVLNDNYMHLKFYFMSLINILSYYKRTCLWYCASIFTKSPTKGCWSRVFNWLLLSMMDCMWPFKLWISFILFSEKKPQLIFNTNIQRSMLL